MKRKVLTIATASIFALTSTLRSAESSVMDEISNQNGYSWDMSDKDQVTQMKGMILWGFVLAIASALLAGLIPNSPAQTTTTGKAADQGSSLFQ